jgi:ATP-dependent RNA helicase RhlE
VTNTTFAELGVAEPLLRALIADNYIQPTPIQEQAIPPLLAGRDLMGIAQTGTGKTAAFALPILQQLEPGSPDRQRRGTRALILAPTRELAIQICDSFTNYGRHLSLRRTVIFGGVGQNPQVRVMSGGVDILVATPGRLLDLMQQGHVRLDGVTHLVLDEADRMLDMGFIRDIRKIMAKVPKERQTMLFSATMPTEITRLANDILNQPLRVEVTPKVMTVDLIDQFVYFVDGPRKRDLLAHLLKKEELARVIVFTRTKHGANKVSLQLEKSGVPSDAIHGNKSQNARQRALEDFRAGKIRVLVATDIAARGIDVDGVTHVINYELPNIAESYVHRIGRTARAGAAGVAIAFCDSEERAYLRDIERLTHQPLTVIKAENVETLPRTANDEKRLSSKPSKGSRNNGNSRQNDRDPGRAPRRRRRNNNGGNSPASRAA